MRRRGREKSGNTGGKREEAIHIMAVAEPPLLPFLLSSHSMDATNIDDGVVPNPELPQRRHALHQYRRRSVSNPELLLVPSCAQARHPRPPRYPLTLHPRRSFSFLFSQVFIPVLKDSQASVAERTACMEVLLASLTHDPALFRTHVLKE